MGNRRLFTRTNLASAASIAGVLALILGGLIFLTTGEISVAVFACVVVGAAGIGLWMGLDPSDLQGWLSGRQTRYGTSSILITLIFIGLVAYGYVLVDRANITADLTSIQRYSLNTPTLDTIAELKERGYQVRILGFFSHNTLSEQESADLLLRQYANKGQGTIEVQYIDPDEQPDLAEAYSYRSEFDGKLLLTVLDSNGQPRTKQVVNEQGEVLTQNVTIYLGSADERSITTGLKTVASAGVFKVYFTTGHGERSLTKIDDTGISMLYGTLDGQGIGAESLELTSRVPDDASAVLIVGAWQDFTEAEVGILDEYLQRGGRLGIFADPPLLEASILGLEGNTFLQEGGPLNNYLWDTFGLRVRDDLAVETKYDATNPNVSYFDVDEWAPIIHSIAPHTILNGVQDVPIYMRYVRTIDLAQDPTSQQAMYVRYPLLYTSDESFAETNLTEFLNGQLQYLPGEDIPGPLLVAVTAQRGMETQQTIQPRIIIVGDSDVLKNGNMKLVGNVYLWNDVVDWLTGFAKEVTFQPVSDPTLFPLSASAQERRTIVVITVFVVPGLILFAGAAVWWYRQR